MARTKYLFFADKARQEGYAEVAELFERMAQNEGVHGKLMYQRLCGIGSTADNLQEAMTGEYGEWTKLYPGYAQTAREEGLDEIAVLFEQISQIEKDHEFRFMSALAGLKATTSAAKVRTTNPGAGGLVTVTAVCSVALSSITGRMCSASVRPLEPLSRQHTGKR